VFLRNIMVKDILMPGSCKCVTISNSLGTRKVHFHPINAFVLLAVLSHQ